MTATGGPGLPWEQFFSQSPTAMWISEEDLDGPVWAVNAALCQLLGRTAEQVMGVGLTGLFPPATGGADNSEGSESARTGRVTLPDGSQRWLTATSTALDGPSGPLMLVEVRDSTPARDSDGGTFRTQAFNVAVLSAVPDAVSIVDVATRRTTWASKSLEDVLGYGSGEVQRLQSQGVALGHPDDADKIEAAFAALADCPDGQVVNSASRVRHADGTWHVLSRRTTPFRRDETGALVEAINVARDVTEQEAIAAEMDSVRAFQQAVIAATPDLIYIKDLATGRPTWTSRDPDALLGYPAKPGSTDSRAVNCGS
jgi:PAS domain S-box-containing protein